MVVGKVIEMYMKKEKHFYCADYLPVITGKMAQQNILLSQHTTSHIITLCNHNFISACTHQSNGFKPVLSMHQNILVFCGHYLEDVNEYEPMVTWLFAFMIHTQHVFLFGRHKACSSTSKLDTCWGFSS